jgi:isobutyryl-CoA mutase
MSLNTISPEKKEKQPNLAGHRDSEPYKPSNKVRIVTAASLFDGHDAAINIMRRIIQATGCEVIHLGHDRSVEEVVNTAIQEDAQAIALTSYQGGHNEYFKYMYDLLQQKGAGHIKIFGGGGGVILPDEINELMRYGITRIYSPDDGRAMGLQGMINDLVKQSDYPSGVNVISDDRDLNSSNHLAIAQLISGAENHFDKHKDILERIRQKAAASKAPVLGITGTGGAGKSSIVDEIVRRFVMDFKDKTIGIVSVDPSKRKTGGALLGDRIRMNAINNPRVYMRSLATRQSNLALSAYVKEAVSILKAAGFDLIILETSGIGQSDTEILDHSDVSLYVMTPEYGAATQLEKIDMLDFADVIALNKFDKRGALDALRDVKKQYQRNHQLWDKNSDDMPVFGTIASQFNDPGTNQLYKHIIETIVQKTGSRLSSSFHVTGEMSEKVYVIPPHRTRYLSEISENNRKYDDWTREQKKIAQKLYAFHKTIETLRESSAESKTELIKELELQFDQLKLNLDPKNFQVIQSWKEKLKKYSDPLFKFKVRDKEIAIQTHTESLSHTQVPKVALPRYESWGEVLQWTLQENVPGEFPYTAGIYPFKREGEDPTRMFAGEGGPERTNRRFHYVSLAMPAKRLSTAFDSVTLYGNDPDYRPDIYGKIGNSGVSICCLDDAKKLYSGFNLADPRTSVSMTINGPAPMLLGYFMNAAIDQQCEIYIRQNGLVSDVEKKLAKKYPDGAKPSYQGNLPLGNDGLGLMLLGITGDEVLPKDVYQKIKADTLSQVRGTVQADILKEDQAQNTCIFSTEFALRLMGDVQQYFIDHDVRNFYSVSISGYHIAEAGANPITQLAFTLANGFTYVEYYLSRGMHIDDFAPNLSFFFSNGVDPEYSVIGRVARRIWAKAMKHKYGANARSQMLKYHIQTSGRSLHAQEIDFNDIRTTLQALYAIYDNCNSLHTNAYDEAITTPTEESVRRAMAIQLIINKELGLAKNENPLQGSFIIETYISQLKGLSHNHSTRGDPGNNGGKRISDPDAKDFA